MELKESDDHRCHLAEYEDCKIPTIQLGDGGVIINDLFFEGNEYVGVGFSLGEGEIGQDHPENKGKLSGEVGVFLQIVSTEPESLQVLIDRLISVKNEQEYKLGRKLRPNTKSA